jgi:hypothetical protein
MTAGFFQRLILEKDKTKGHRSTKVLTYVVMAWELDPGHWALCKDQMGEEKKGADQAQNARQTSDLTR